MQCMQIIFHKRKKCYSRKEANEWKSWAETNCDLCPSCWRDQKNMDVIKNGVHYETYLYLEGIIDMTINKDLVLIFDKNSYGVKEKLKELGAKYVENRWIILCALDNYAQLVEKLKRIPSINDSEPTDKDIEFFKSLRHKKEEALKVINTEKKAKLSEIEECLSSLGDISQKISNGAYWNGKFYGNSGEWLVFIDDAPIAISDTIKDGLTRLCILNKQMKNAEKQKITSINDEIQQCAVDYRNDNIIIKNWVYEEISDYLHDGWSWGM